jgi:hypothetical protein
MMCRARRKRSIWGHWRRIGFSGGNMRRRPTDKRKELLQLQFLSFLLYLSSAKALLDSSLAHIGSQTLERVWTLWKLALLP